MSEEQEYEYYILNAIEYLLKFRKARPDLDRIADYVNRTFGVSEGVENHVNNLLKKGILREVHFKGITGYRNARMPNVEDGSPTETTVDSLPRVVFQAIKEAKKKGIKASLEWLYEFACSKKKDLNMPLMSFSKIIDHVVKTKSLLELKNGEYVMKPSTKRIGKRSLIPAKELLEVIDADVPENTQENVLTSKNENLNGKAKTKAKIMRPSQTCPPVSDISNKSQPNLIKKYKKKSKLCIYCNATKSMASDKEKIEDPLVCQTCHQAAHPSCMLYSEELTACCRSYAWQCIDCKSCSICNDTGHANTMLFCDACDKGYHKRCHVPKLTGTPTGAWVCSECKRYHEESSKEKSSIVTPPPAPRIHIVDDKHSEKKPVTVHKVKSEVPTSDACNWSTDEVMQFFKAIGFIDEASAFQDQEIDGKSLLLLRREDVLTGLSLKLGPALKIYKYISKLQNGLNALEAKQKG